MAKWLAGTGITPNAISIAGMVFGCLAGGVLAATASLDSWSIRAAWLAGAVFVQLRLLANMFDGMVAIERDVASAVGELYNEIPDRVSDAAILIGLGYGIGGEPVLGYVAAGVAIFVAYVRAMGVAAGAAQAFTGPMAKPQRMFAVTVAAVYCGLAPASWQPEFGPDGRGIASFVLALVVLGGLWTAARRVHRIARDLREASA